MLWSESARADDAGLIGHWKLQGDCLDYSGQDNHATNHGVNLERGEFNGTGAYLEVPHRESLNLGAGDFTFSTWLYTEKQLDDVVGDVFEMYDPAARRGITLSINSTTGSFQSQGTDRHVYFGIDNAKMSDWQDCGRPSEASNYVSESMCVYKGKLYAATTGGRDEKDWRHVFRYEGGQKWEDCGQVGDGSAQGVGPLIVHNGDLYATTWTVDWTRVREGGYTPGRVYRYLGGQRWEDCGQPSENRTLNCIASYGGKLYVGGGADTWGVFTQDGNGGWTPSKIFSKEGPRRCFPHSMAVFNGRLFTGYPVAYAFDGNEWDFVGKPFDYDVNGLQLYCLTPHQGKLCAGAWPVANVAVYDGGEEWHEIGRVGEDGTEVNGLIVYNGKLYGGSLPRAEVCRYEGDKTWTSLKRFYSPEGWKPGIPYNCSRDEVNEWVRLTAFAIYDGMLFASTGSCTSSVLDAPIDVRGKVFAMEAGRNASYDDDIGPGWKHITAMREGGLLKLFVGGKLVAKSRLFEPADYDLSTDLPLRIGFGQLDHFAGRMADVRLYKRALKGAEIKELASRAAPATVAKSAAQIILAGDASRVDRFAAKELKRCLTAALDWNVEIADANSNTAGTPTFYVGSIEGDITKLPGFPALDADKRSSIVEDGVYLKGDGAAVALVGQGTRGSLNAVYEFLEKYAGYRWPEPGREHGPQFSSLNLNFEHVHNPAFAYRGVALHGPTNDDFHIFYSQILDWLAKNRLNSVQFSCEVYDQVRPRFIEAILDRGLSPKIGAHSRQYFYASNKYFPLRPEYFALVNGKRTGDTQLCYSNHASVDAYAENIIEYLKSHPEIGVIGLWPSDGYGFCECNECKAKPTTDVLLEYINDVAERIHAEFPKVKVEFLSYIHYTTPPANVKPLPYVVPTYCEYWSRSQFHPITDDRESNAKLRGQMEQWAQASHQATVYSYYADETMKRFLYNPVPDVVLTDLQYYKQIGMAGSSVLMMYPQSWWVDGPHMYAYAKAAWDSSATLEQTSDDYFRSLYGPAAKSMKAHQRAARCLFDAEFDHGETGEQMLFGFRIKKFNPDGEESTKAKYNDGISQLRKHLAAAKAENPDPWVHERIHTLDQSAQLMGNIYGILNEAAGYKVDRDQARKDRLRAHIASFHENEVAKEDIRCKVLHSLMPHVVAVLGPKDAAQYDRVAVHPIE
jgi:hypothetical protein